MHSLHAKLSAGLGAAVAPCSMQHALAGAWRQALLPQPRPFSSHHQRGSGTVGAAGPNLADPESALQLSAAAAAAGAQLRRPSQASMGATALAPSSPRPRRTDKGMRLQMVPGIGPKNEALFVAQGVTTIEDLKTLHFNAHQADEELTKAFVVDAVGIRNRSHVGSIMSYLQQVAVKTTPVPVNNRFTLSVEGNISAGKSTFLQILQRKGLDEDLQVVPEPVEKWQNVGAGKVNLLMEFYKAPERFAYTFQNYVFLTRLVQERDSYMSTKMCRLLERSVFSDRMVFVRAVHSAKFMNDTELSIYDSWFDPVLKTLPTLVPNGFIYLRAGPDTCHRRMVQRGRNEEGAVQLDYLQGLHANHEDWLFSGNQQLGRSNSPGYLYVPPTGQVLTSPSMSGLDLNAFPPPPGAASLTMQSASAMAASAVSCKFQLPSVPSALRDNLYILDAKNRAHMHPTLDQIPALVIDCEEDVDVDRDEVYQEHIANQVKQYTYYVRDFMKAKGDAVQGTAAQAPYNGYFVQDRSSGAVTYTTPPHTYPPQEGGLWLPQGGAKPSLVMS